MNVKLYDYQIGDTLGEVEINVRSITPSRMARERTMGLF
jgi:hypothetical protein